MDIETKRLCLRPLNDDDAVAIASGLNNYAVAKNLARVKFPYSVVDAQDFIGRQRGFDARSKLCAIAFRAAPEELIGIVSYEQAGLGATEFGYWLRECCWHMGLMTEAATALVAHGFASGDVETLHSCYHLDNPNSGRILRTLGFVETREEMNFSVAQCEEVAVMKMKLTSERWRKLAHS